MGSLSTDGLHGVFGGHLVGKVRRLPSDNAALQESVETQSMASAVLRADNQILLDEVARLKSLSRQPSIGADRHSETKNLFEWL